MKGISRIGALAIGVLAVGSSSAAANVGRLGTRESGAYAARTFNRTIFETWHGFGDHRGKRGDRGDRGEHQYPPVPEPNTWLMLLVGSGLVGFQLWRKQRAVNRSLNAH